MSDSKRLVYDVCVCVCVCVQNAEGAGLAPFDCWLALRGMKTMALRMEKSSDNCAKLAEVGGRCPRAIEPCCCCRPPDHLCHCVLAVS